jgi:hypothetical protein
MNARSAFLKHAGLAASFTQMFFEPVFLLSRSSLWRFDDRRNGRFAWIPKSMVRSERVASQIIVSDAR